MAANNQTRRSQVHRRSSLGKGLLVAHHRLSVQGTTYVKDLEFPADGPGRVIVRLERLMGSDRIRITDTKYMATLLQRLQEEEEITWQKRTRERRKAEHKRFRQLVIDGYTEPTPAMEDLYNHPIFRVNRILNRLSKLNSNVTPAINLPPIIPVDPFKVDDTGRVFKSYPGHFSFSPKSDKETAESVISILESLSLSHMGQQMDAIPEISQSGADMLVLNEGELEDDDENEQEEEEEGEEGIKGEFYSTMMEPKRTDQIALSTSSVQKPAGNIMLSPSVDKSSVHVKLSPGPSLERHIGGHTGISTASHDMKTRKRNSKADKRYRGDGEMEAETHEPQVLTLLEIQKKYGVAPNTNLGVQWKPYQSQIMETLFHDEKRGVSHLYEMGTAITDMYDRQQQTMDDYIESLARKNEENLSEGSRVSGESEEDDGEEEEFDDGDDVPALSEIGEFEDGLQEVDEEALEPLSQSKSDTAMPPTWDNLEEMWEKKADRKSVPEEHEDSGQEE